MKFTESKGGAEKNKIEQYQLKNGDNAVRFFGELCPRYVYWVPGKGKTLPVECLGFDREQEKFTNAEKDWVKEAFPDLKAGWAYSVQCIDLSDGQAKIFNLKRTLMDQIIQAAKELGDPCDPDDGWEVHFTRKKTGPNKFNVDYMLDQIKSMKNKKPMTDEQRKVMEAAIPIEKQLPRPTPETQKEFLDKLLEGGEEENVDESISEDFDVS